MPDGLTGEDVDFAEVVRRRRMVRRYRPDPLDPAVLHRVLETATRGPSAGFSQGTTFVVVTDPQRRAAVAAACGEHEAISAGRPAWLSTAPVHVVPCASEAAYRRRYAEPDKARSGGPDAWATPFWWMDGGAALMLLLLAAADAGLGAGFLAVERAAVAGLLGLRDDEQPLGLVTLGHPAADDRPAGSAVSRPRRGYADLVRHLP